MKNQITRLLIVAGLAAAFVAGAASHLIPGANSVTTVAAQEKHEALKDVRTARDMMQQARGLLGGAPGSFGGHREKSMKFLDMAIGEANQAVEVREHENH
jgi:hypothetical protein